MPRRDDAPVGAPCWIELFTTDTDAACAFYGELFGWTADSAGADFGGYVNLSLGDDRIAGCMAAPADHDGPTNFWTVYLAVADAAATSAAAEAHGGEVFLAPTQVADLGTMAILADPGGAGVGVWQPGSHRGFAVLGESGTPAWFELHTRAYAASVRFYEDVFGWTTQVVADGPGFRYTTFDEGDDGLAGIMDAPAFLPDEAPSSWSVYFGTDDTDVALVRIAELGGSVLEGAQDSPYGRLATVADPLGATFRVIQPPV